MSAPAMRASARQQPKEAANQSQYDQKIGSNEVQVSSYEFLTINSRCGRGYADHP